MTESKICTCPSGNGSLRHPCPAHPASVEQAGGDERVIGWRERILAAHPNSDPGFWPDALLVEHMAAEIADLRAALARVAELTATRNRYGVDAHYFNKNLQRILRDFESFTPEELARSLIILAKVADEKVVAQAQHSVPDGYRLIRLEHFAAIKAQFNPEQVDAYRGRNIYDEDKVYANWNAYRSALDEIKDVFQQIDWDAENELAELLAAAPGKEVGHE
ncbi:TPA: hypothetical protein L4U85_003817 [Pseudomonas aeruginosa]|nr:hypothetical protein [Pseudomonas aeruginosa]